MYIKNNIRIRIYLVHKHKAQSANVDCIVYSCLAAAPCWQHLFTCEKVELVPLVPRPGRDHTLYTPASLSLKRLVTTGLCILILSTGGVGIFFQGGSRYVLHDLATHRYLLDDYGGERSHKTWYQAAMISHASQ